VPGVFSGQANVRATQVPDEPSGLFDVSGGWRRARTKMGCFCSCCFRWSGERARLGCRIVRLAQRTDRKRLRLDAKVSLRPAGAPRTTGTPIPACPAATLIPDAPTENVEEPEKFVKGALS
jgi:hypothetical protein